MDRRCRGPVACRRLAQHDRGGRASRGERTRIHRTARLEAALQGHEGVAADSVVPAHPGVFEADLLQEGAACLCRGDAPGRLAADPGRGAGGRPARDGADGRRQGAALRGLGRGCARAERRGGASGRSRCGLRRPGEKVARCRDGARRARQPGASCAADGAGLERGLRPCRRARAGHGGRASPARPCRARWPADRRTRAAAHCAR
ncbi:hypothetical protein ABIF39_005761 [Bradyrhizobium diazoefficiens]